MEENMQPSFLHPHREAPLSDNLEGARQDDRQAYSFIYLFIYWQHWVLNSGL
jgi:hypothetical protein